MGSNRCLAKNNNNNKQPKAAELKNFPALQVSAEICCRPTIILLWSSVPPFSPSPSAVYLPVPPLLLSRYFLRFLRSLCHYHISWRSALASFFNDALFPFGALLPLRVPLRSSPSGYACSRSILPVLLRLRLTLCILYCVYYHRSSPDPLPSVKSPIVTLSSRSFSALLMVSSTDGQPPLWGNP